MATKKRKKRIQVRKKATKAVKALGRRRETQLIDWLYEGYISHYQPDVHYQQYVEEYDDKIVRSVYARCKLKDFNISFDDLNTFYGMRRKRFRKRQQREYKKRLEQQCIRVTFLGTAYAHAMNFYNTCFAIRDHKKTFLVDTGGGQTIIRQLNKAQIGFNDLHDIFITHKHLDHFIGLLFIIQRIGRLIKDGKYEGDLTIYGNEEVIETIRQVIPVFSHKEAEYFDNRIKLVVVHNGETCEIIGQKVTFFDTEDGRMQYGFVMETRNGVSFAYTGDVPMKDSALRYVKGVDYLVHEAYCKHADRKKFKPYEKGHSTLKEACENFHKADARYLIITHTEDSLGDKRGPQYRHEAAVDHHTSIMVPEDLETIFLKKPSKQRSYFDTQERTEKKVDLEVNRAARLKKKKERDEKTSFNVMDLSEEETPSLEELLMQAEQDAAYDIIAGEDIADSIIESYIRVFEEHPELMYGEDPEDIDYDFDDDIPF